MHEVGADAEGQADALVKLPVQRDDLGNGEHVAEHQGLGAGIDAVLGIVRNHLFAPGEGVARVVPGAVEQFAEIQIEVAQEGLQTIHIGQGDAQVAAVFLGPRLEGEHLGVAQARAQRLAGLQVFVRHSAQRGEAHVFGEQHIAGARKLGAEAAMQPPEHLGLPAPRVAAAGAVVGDAAVLQLRGMEQGNLVGKTRQARVLVGIGMGVAGVHLADDGEHRHFEQNGVQPGALNGDVDLAAFACSRVGSGCGADALAVEAEQRKEIDKIALDETQAAQVVEFVGFELQGAEGVEFGVDLAQPRHQIDPGRAAFEAVLHLRAGKVMQHHLHHGELVEVGVEQGFDDHGLDKLRRWRDSALAQSRRSTARSRWSCAASVRTRRARSSSWSPRRAWASSAPSRTVRSSGRPAPGRLSSLPSCTAWAMRVSPMKAR